MTIEELYIFLGDFIEKHPKCKDKPIMVKKLEDDSSWEEVTIVTDTVVTGCPEYGSPLYFHSPSQEKLAQQRIEKMKEIDEDDDYYM